jgi:FkbM family methyltransferase
MKGRSKISPYIPLAHYPKAPDWEMTLRILAGRGIFERRSFQNFMNGVRGHDVAIDVGAHVGSWTLGMSRCFNRVISFEPHPVNRSYLMRNMERANATNVMVCSEALVNRPNLKQEFSISAAGTTRNSGMAHLVSSGEKTPSATPVICSTLDKVADTLIMAGQRVNALKVDVEGLELAVIQGGQHIIETFKPTIMLEINGRCAQYGVRQEDVFDHMSDIGYREVSRSR